MAGPGGGRGDPSEFAALGCVGVAAVQPACQFAGETGIVGARILPELCRQFPGGVFTQDTGRGADDGQQVVAVVQLKPPIQGVAPAVSDLLQCEAGQVRARAGDPGLPHRGCLGSVHADGACPFTPQASAYASAPRSLSQARKSSGAGVGSSLMRDLLLGVGGAARPGDGGWRQHARAGRVRRLTVWAWPVRRE